MAENPFDALSTRVFETVVDRMGYDATWTPSAGGPEQTARVLYGEPTQDEKLGEFGDTYSPRTFFMEYWDDVFLGLYDSVRLSKEEYVYITIRGVERRFYVMHEESKYDGRNYRVKLEELV